MSEQMQNEGDEAETAASAAPTQPNTIDSGALEKGPEHIPDLQEVNAVMGALINIGKQDGLVSENGEIKVTKQTMDEKGLYELEIEIEGVEEGEKVGYEYRRFAIPDRTGMKVVPPGLPEIHVVYYTDGDPMGGDTAARCINGEWKPLLRAAWLTI